MNILITGSTGFVGRHFINFIKDNLGFKLFIVSRNNTKFNHDNIHYINLDLKNKINWLNILKNIDVIVHMAASQHQKKINSKINLSYENINFTATNNLVKSVKNSQVKKFIFLSSIKVMGEFSVNNNIINESNLPNPQDDYSFSKLKAENTIIEKLTNSNTKFFIIRCPLIYGPEAKGNFKSLISLVKSNLPLPFGKLNSKRSMISIYNLVDFILHLININHLKNEILFVSDNDDLSVKSLCKLLIKNLNKSNHIFNLNLKILYYILLIIGKKEYYAKMANPFQVDISKTLKITKWKPIYTADESIKKIFKL